MHPRWILLFGLALQGFSSAHAIELHVARGGSDAAEGSASQPFATLHHAQQVGRKFSKAPVTIVVHDGTHYLTEPLVFTAQDSGSPGGPVRIVAAPGTRPVLSGGQKLTLAWQPRGQGLFQAATPPGIVIDQLFLNGVLQPMARYPDFDPSQPILNGFAADAISPGRAARWADPTGGFIHAMHSARWGGYHFRITGKNADHSPRYEGGWQNNRQMGMHKQHRFVENIREELDAPGEWFHDARTNTLLMIPPVGIDVNRATIEVVRLRHLVEFQGTRERPVAHVTLAGLTFRHAARTFMETREPLLRSDWTIYRGGAVLFRGAQDCGLEQCVFDQVGGNAVFVSGWNNRIALRGCRIENVGGNGVCFVGEPNAVRNPLFEYRQRLAFAALDRQVGPRSEEYPRECRVEDCLITRTGRVEKQTAGVQISMSAGITVLHCSIYEMPRAGININEGTFGGHVIEFCDVFDTVLETGDHGSFNSWGRDRYWGVKDAPAEQLPQLARLDMIQPNILRNSRWRCDHGWDVDLDDGSSNYEIVNNLMLQGGLKLREGFHRVVRNNITVNNSLHPHVWYANSGDTVTGNIFMGPYKPAGGMPAGRWGQEIDRNWFTTTESDRAKFSRNGCDAHSRVGDPGFVDPARGDFRVRDDSAVRSIGFENFPMDQFGVRSLELKRLARTPRIPPLGSRAGPIAETRDAKESRWQGARVRNVAGEGDVSAAGLPSETGVLLLEVPAESPAAQAGLKAFDVILGCGGKPAHAVSDLFALTNRPGRVVLSVWRDQAKKEIPLTIAP